MTSQSPDYWRGVHDCSLTIRCLIKREKTSVTTQRYLNEIIADIEQKAIDRWRGVLDCIRFIRDFQQLTNPQRTFEEFLQGVQETAEHKAGMSLATILPELKISVDQVKLNPLAEALGISFNKSTPFQFILSSSDDDVSDISGVHNVVCPNCGASNNNDARFCRFCKERLIFRR